MLTTSTTTLEALRSLPALHPNLRPPLHISKQLHRREKPTSFPLLLRSHFLPTHIRVTTCFFQVRPVQHRSLFADVYDLSDDSQCADGDVGHSARVSDGGGEDDVGGYD